MLGYLTERGDPQVPLLKTPPKALHLSAFRKRIQAFRKETHVFGAFLHCFAPWHPIALWHLSANICGTLSRHNAWKLRKHPLFSLIPPWFRLTTFIPTTRFFFRDSFTIGRLGAERFFLVWWTWNCRRQTNINFQKMRKNAKSSPKFRIIQWNWPYANNGKTM